MFRSVQLHAYFSLSIRSAAVWKPERFGLLPPARGGRRTPNYRSRVSLTLRGSYDRQIPRTMTPPRVAVFTRRCQPMRAYVAIRPALVDRKMRRCS